MVTDAILKEMEKEGVDYEYLSFEKVPECIIKEHFPNIYSHCLAEGYDLLKEPVPIVPAQHYFMGGPATMPSSLQINCTSPFL